MLIQGIKAIDFKFASEMTFKAIFKAKRPKIVLLYKKRRVSPSSVNEFLYAKKEANTAT